jgi:hypothetical protein
MHREARSVKSRRQRRSRRNHRSFVAILKLTRQVQGVPQSATSSMTKAVGGRKVTERGASVLGLRLADFVGHSAKICQVNPAGA